MIPIFWRYLLSQYLKYFVYCVVTFVAVLITTRLDDIAHFATLGPEGRLIFLYVLYQIPYILPIAIPLSCLIASIIIVQNLSKSHELTALRAAGLSLKAIFAPLLGASLVLAVTNFVITSELTTHSHLSMNRLKNELRSINPLLLLHNKHLMHVKGFYFDTLGPSKMGETASNVVFATPNNDNSRINLLLADRLTTTPNRFYGKDVTIISSLGDGKDEGFDRLIIENIQAATTSINDFTKTVDKKVWSLKNDYLRLSLLLARLDEEKNFLSDGKRDERPINFLKQVQRNITRCHTEILKRVSVGFAPFTFTLMGAAFGISISRYRSGRGLFYVIVLSALYLISFFAAKGSGHLLVTSSFYYFVPHILIWGLSFWMISKVTRGVE